ncbi:putative bifunctional diguanylate cyclase/phosphodiesterase [Geodermatophilus obscurus]|uniref:Diguanylate cyclase/phosphodiesterase with PAS/PAC sensor(S) n=1 Tax=Geodermatophilus obscurus (strain ATCC 25078 / DSM 43160 / JCM 3152 / CCUG 61914 / KCC A-0152 / KCTC 9177 / NBRC 13315 / NRRL B-3577 / G-20) TaxID=526225 RepID=D2SFV3_GEOOG|nr:bifunctional diguanylate cyclase/phosphodiesterase [Geodermatophilus obscurus]ADB74858.1 diguanylate cyclase/phosphodiesterase with PAS/PAC sensor(s) [Geodermatophilus obscurus DSM 43160]
MSTTATAVPLVPTEIVSSVFYGAAVSDTLVLLLAEVVDGTPRIAWGNEGATQLLGYGVDDLQSLTVAALVPSLRGAEVGLLLRRERSARMNLSVRTASGALLGVLVLCTPTPSGRTWTLQLVPVDSGSERVLRATAEAHERRLATLTERSPVPTVLSEQGMRLAHVNDAFCSLVGLQAEQLLGTGWMATVHPDDLDDVIEQVVAVLGGRDGRIRARLVRGDGGERTTVLRLSQLFTPGVGAGFVGTIEDITDRLAFEARLAHQAHHDPLTGLPNRTLLAEHVAERFRPGTGRLAVISLDLDDLTVVNESLGHAAGDELLVEVATRLRATVRPGDLVARSGGDGFVVIGEDLDEDAAVTLAERIAAALAQSVRLGGVDVRPHASVGVTVQTTGHHAAEDLIRDGDIAVCQAKAGGKGRISVLDERARAEARDKLRLVAELREAIERREITLLYQPIFRADDGAPVAVESLARWHHPLRGPISPTVFVALAEEGGLIGVLGLLVLDETCRQLAEWDRVLGGAAPQRANVNVSALQLDEHLHGHVVAALERHGLHPSRLQIEITESALMEDPSSARDVLDQLRDLGVSLAIDDFGTGYSSLSYLRHLPVDVLKVDRSFVAELADGHPEIASAVIALARSLDLTTVAEGVETEEQAAQLADLGAGFLQGFALARPMTGDRAAAWYAASAR